MYFTFHQRDSRSKMVYSIPTLLLILYTAKNISDSIIPIPPTLCDHWNSWPDNVYPPATFYRTCIAKLNRNPSILYFFITHITFLSFSLPNTIPSERLSSVQARSYQSLGMICRLFLVQKASGN